MLIDFNAIPETVVPHMRDGEKEVHLRKYQDELGKWLGLKKEKKALEGIGKTQEKTQNTVDKQKTVWYTN